MTWTIERLTARDFDATLALLGRAFAEHGVTDFATLLPALYQPTDEHQRHNLGLWDGGRLVALLGVFPLTWRVGDEELAVAGIGGVSTDPEHRGRGLMGALLTEARRLIAAERFDLALLRGQRQRYRRYGWEVAGSRVRLALDRRNLAALAPLAPAVELAPLAADTPLRPDLERLHRAQRSYCVRPSADFLRHLRGWAHEPFVARAPDGRLVGYLVASPKTHTVFELVAGTPEQEVDLLRAYAARHDGTTEVVLPPTPSPLLARLAAEAELTTVEPSGSYWVLDWARVAGALLRFRHACTPLAPGEVVLSCEGQTFRLFVEPEGVGAAPSAAPSAMNLDGPTLTRLLFGPLPPDAVTALPPGAELLRAWCPLPLDLPVQDHV